MNTIRAIRGMNDILPDETPLWRHLETVVGDLLAAYGYREIRLPLVESTQLFERSIGEVTDIVEKEMYTFPDRSGESMSLRPEGTAGCVRACTQHGLLQGSQRLWYAGPMFRYERPQKGRQRQFHQIGVECFGFGGPDIDAELLAMSARMWRQLGIADAVTLELNSLGSPAERATYREALVGYLKQHVDAIDDDSRRRLATNPLRILDSKHEGTQAVLAQAPTLEEFLDDSAKAHFAGLCALLDAAGIDYRINPRLVRGLDYYNYTVFEWVTDRLGAQGTVCAGGRYDGLVAQLGGPATPAVGFAMGLERLCLLLETVGSKAPADAVDAYFVVAGDGIYGRALALSERLREALPALKLVLHAGGGSFKSQLKKADRSGAAVALILGEDEVAAGEITVKPLRAQGGEQSQVGEADLVSWLSAHLQRAPAN